MKLSFNNRAQSEFVKELRSRVDDYFASNNISKYANGKMIFKTSFFFVTWLGSYLMLVLGNNTFETNIIFWITLGFSIAFITVNVGHDAIHGAYSSKKWVNQLLSHTFNFNGASAYMWTKMHNTAHHTYTNVDGYDEDIESVPIIRLSPTQRLRKIHRYQYLYIIPFYGLATLSWVLIKDYVKFFKNEVGNFNGSSHPRKEYFYLFFYKLIHYFFFIAVPLMVMKDSVGLIIAGLLIMHFFAGMTLALIFMLAHVVEQTHFPQPDIEGSLENSWAVHQLYTTANFSKGSELALFLTGGLNLQVEHHLFPNICSIHYKELSPIVEQTAREFGLPYLQNRTFLTALASHVRFLKKMGQSEDYEPLEYAISETAK
jgi:linoleoyl-CoA desaturase